jgi:hypothetical protein
MFATLPVLSRSLTVGVFLATLPGCAGAGLESLADILAAGGMYGGDVSGEIRRIDTRRQEIEVESGWGGAERVRYDGRTEVYHGQRRYDVRSLERGDLVRMRVENDRGEPYASVIEVQGSVNDRGGIGRGGRSDRLERIGGSVGRIDDRAGWFELFPGRNRAIMVVLPYDPPRSVREQFRRLRRGQRVNVEAYMIDNSRAELYRFR